mmetsp:Transcript_20466/g.51971  ORF Transcript_20466/g.51971 Transcript_20466/m.51971 type:complete len:215 (+) Transcript_20466:246-890(+)
MVRVPLGTMTPRHARPLHLRQSHLNWYSTSSACLSARGKDSSQYEIESSSAALIGRSARRVALCVSPSNSTDALGSQLWLKRCSGAKSAEPWKSGIALTARATSSASSRRAISSMSSCSRAVSLLPVSSLPASLGAPLPLPSPSPVLSLPPSLSSSESSVPFDSEPSSDPPSESESEGGGESAPEPSSEPSSSSVAARSSAFAVASSSPERKAR